MRYRALDKNGDYSFGNNSQDYLSGVDAIAQAIKTKILLFYGEWWENIGIGIPMFQSIIGQANPEMLKTSVSLLIEQRILEIEEVVSVENTVVTIEGRKLSFEVTVNTRDEQITVEVAA